MDKAALRAVAAARRAKAKAAGPNAGEALVMFFPAHLIPPPGSVVSGYWPIRSEIDPRPLMRALAARGLDIALPVTPPKGSNQPLSFRLWREADAISPGAFAIHEPGLGSPLVEPDLLLCPLLAFDRFGGRLGYGAGHYDRTLAQLATRRLITAIGLAYAAQAVERVPMDDRDTHLDGIVTETAYIEAMNTLSDKATPGSDA